MSATNICDEEGWASDDGEEKDCYRVCESDRQILLESNKRRREGWE